MKKNRIKKVLFAIIICCFASTSSFIAYAMETNLEEDKEVIIEPKPEKISTVITHQHTGSSSGGGCYGHKNTYSETTYCNKSLTQVSWNMLVCSDGHIIGNNVSGGWDTWPHPSCCNVSTGTKTYTYYTVNCGRTGEVLGNLSIVKPSTEWAKEVTLNAEYEVANGVKLSENPVVFTGNNREEETTEFVVTENGTYTCRLQMIGTDNNAKSHVIKYVVKNIDVTPPTISSIEYDKSLFLGEVEVTVDAKDLQEDGSEGIGLPDTPYSYDGGETWIAENTYTINKNGTYTVMVKDLFDQITTEEIEVTTLDTMGPTVSTIIQENLDTKSNSVKVLVYVEDLQEDGSEGSGMGENPYSFDGGKTWQGLGYYYFHGNGTHTILIRDVNGNITKANVIIQQFPEPHKPSTSTSTPTPVIPPIVKEEEILEDPMEEPIEKPIEEPIEEPIVSVPKQRIEEEKEEIPKLGIIEPDRTETVVVHYKQPKQYEAPEEIDVDELEASKQELENEALIHEKRMEEVKKIVMISTTAVASISGICALLYCFLFMTVVLGKTNQNGNRFLGIAKIKRGEKMEIHIPNWVYERSTTHIIMVYMNPFVAHKYALEPVIIYVNESEYLYSIEPVIQVEVTLM